MNLLAVAALPILLLAQDEKKTRDPRRILQDPLGPWKVQYFERNARGEQVLVAQVSGDRADPTGVEKLTLEVTRLRALFFTDPADAQDRSQKIGLVADSAIYSESLGTLRLRGGVRIVSEDGAELETSEIDLDLKRRRFSTLQDFKLAGTTLSFTGRGLEADESLHQLLIRERGRVAGRMSDPRTPADAESKPYLRFESAGPMSVFELKRKKRAIISGSGGTEVWTTGGDADARLSAETATMIVARKEKEVELETMALEGDARLESSGNRVRSQRARVDRLTGRAEFAGDVETEFVPDPNAGTVRIRAHELVQQSELSEGVWRPLWMVAVGAVSFDGFGIEAGEPVRGECAAFHYDVRERKGRIAPDGRIRLRRGESRIEADDCRIDEVAGRTEFCGNVAADLQRDPSEKPIGIHAGSLVEQSETVDGVRRPARIEARDDVRMEIPAAEGRASAQVRCGAFLYDARTQAGILEGNPWVRIVSERSVLYAARVLLPDRDTMILQGPKRVRLVDEKGQTWTMATAGDVRVSAREGRIKIVDRCVLFSKDSRVSADRIDVRLGADRKGVESIRGFGRVEIHRPAEGVRIRGDRMRLAGESASVRGRPFAVVTRPSVEATMAEVSYDLKTGRAEGRRGRERIRFRFSEELQR